MCASESETILASVPRTHHRISCHKRWRYVLQVLVQIYNQCLMWSEFSCLRDDHMHCLVLPWTEDNVLNEWCSIAAQWFERLHVCPSLALLCNDCGIAAQWFERFHVCPSLTLLCTDCGIAAQWFELSHLWRYCMFVLAWHYRVVTVALQHSGLSCLTYEDIARLS